LNQRADADSGNQTPVIQEESKTYEEEIRGGMGTQGSRAGRGIGGMGTGSGGMGTQDSVRPNGNTGGNINDESHHADDEMDTANGVGYNNDD